MSNEPLPVRQSFSNVASIPQNNHYTQQVVNNPALLKSYMTGHPSASYNPGPSHPGLTQIVADGMDYYSGAEYLYEDDMPNRCGIIHIRSPLPDKVNYEEGIM